VTPDVERLLDEAASLVAEHGLVDGDMDALDAAPEHLLVAIEARLAQAMALVAMYRRLQERGRDDLG
jgi:hypothetical protein